VFPPPNSIPVHEIAQVDAPAAGNTVTVLTYKVPSGHRLYLHAVLAVTSGAAVLPGDFLWSIFVQDAGAVSDLQRRPVHGLVNVPIPLGSIDAGVQWPFYRAYDFAPLSVLSTQVENVSGTATKASAGYFGYLVPDIETAAGGRA
jgi:hypothetical protein